MSFKFFLLFALEMTVLSNFGWKKKALRLSEDNEKHNKMSIEVPVLISLERGGRVAPVKVVLLCTMARMQVRATAPKKN